MKWRVIDLETGKLLDPPVSSDFALDFDGKLLVMHWSGYTEDYRYPYILEIAFRKDEENEWVWEHSVIHQ